jgi:hypothetical protein
MNGVASAVVPDGVIAALKEREIGGRLYPGMKPRARVEILLQLLGASQRVTLAADAVEPA